ncbi:MAG TPA: hypothetical protein VLA19_00850 [Herpetosiphonaceae bacterium]|nr:hypothetical protein [Herpetosiphonaceae bacterium]
MTYAPLIPGLQPFDRSRNRGLADGRCSGCGYGGAPAQVSIQALEWRIVAVFFALKAGAQQSGIGVAGITGSLVNPFLVD